MQDETRDPSVDAPEDLIIGTPEVDATFVEGKQGYSDTCAIRVQEFILEQFTGQEFDETDLMEEARSQGWYDPEMGGTPPSSVGMLLEAHGVEANQYQSATTFDLTNELAQGHKVIIGVDGAEMRGQEPSTLLRDIVSNAEVDPGGGADHAVIVSGIDTTDPNNPQVLVSDPATGDAAASYPLDQFVAAWQDSSFFMTATAEPAPNTLPEMDNFPYDEGHIPEVVGVPYDEFVTLRDQLEEWSNLLDQIDAQNTTYAPTTSPETTNVVEPPVVPADLLDPTAPGPTLDPSVFDPNAPGPTLDPCLCDPVAPGPTLDPSLLDPDAPGPTLDPNLLDPTAPGPTIDPSLCDPNAPGPMFDPSVFDPSSPGPTLDPSLLDPSMPGPTLDPSEVAHEIIVDDLTNPATQTEREMDSNEAPIDLFPGENRLEGDALDDTV